MSRLLLVGAGHAHVEIVRRWRLDPVPGVSLTVVEPNPRPVYSGMVPGFVAGEYRQDELEIDLEALCHGARVSWLRDRAKTIDARAGRLYRAAGGPVDYDVASIDVGSTVLGRDLPGVAEHAVASRPMPALVASVARLVAAARAKDGPFVAHVVGGGAGGVELAFCLESRLRREGAAPRVAIVAAEDRLLAGGAAAASRALERAARERGIERVLGARVLRLDERALHLEGGDARESDAVLWVTGAAALPLGVDSGLACDPAGFIATRVSLQVVGHENLFAVGDCASVPGAKRAGVYAVRGAPLLDHNLRAHLAGRPLRRYRPQRDFLSLLNLGDGSALATKWGLAIRGRAVLRVKDRIDRAFVARYR